MYILIKAFAHKGVVAFMRCISVRQFLNICLSKVKKKLFVNNSSGAFCPLETNCFFDDTEYGIHYWITMFGVFFCISNKKLYRCRSPPLIVLKNKKTIGGKENG